ncbi:DUF960 domain-containing protein [Ruminococcus flavefaciens]|uniref:DUF960 domain-containing protein n=1 Tax=Ruminococcus flavefaciens 007c TaxID=1341157 RepID=W7V268_RUMFL|nr:DUF960 domain-containing protein [Ruminococcus flavefaciens]EWM55075.1 hypothetical protein RF007C_05225 [Ruminococcus flavefaciens 007c]
MFNNKRYLSRGVNETIPIELQLFMWERIDQLSEPRDYLQIFNLEQVGSMQSITHRSEEPEYQKVYLLPSEKPITQKIYVIDDDDHSTMLLATEY